MDFLKSFGWRYVSIVYSAGTYGSNGFSGVRKRLENIGYCLAATRRLKDHDEAKEYEVSVCVVYHFQCSGMAFCSVWLTGLKEPTD